MITTTIINRTIIDPKITGMIISKFNPCGFVSHSFENETNNEYAFNSDIGLKHFCSFIKDMV